MWPQTKYEQAFYEGNYLRELLERLRAKLKKKLIYGKWSNVTHLMELFSR